MLPGLKGIGGYVEAFDVRASRQNPLQRCAS
jgi:hypothetical protein